MPTYRVTAEITISVSTEVVASTERQAINKARERPVMSLCHQCASGDYGHEWVTSGELDGDPEGLKAEVIT